MNDIPKLIIGIGLLLVIVGLIWHFGGKFFHLGRLPGDIVIEKENFRFYFPIVTCIVISIVLSLLLGVFRFFR